MPQGLAWKVFILLAGICAAAILFDHDSIYSQASSARPAQAAAATIAPSESSTAKPEEGDFEVRDFRFRSGETLPELRLHYTTLGHPARDTGGKVTNAVLFMHGTGGTGHQFLLPQFAGVLFGPGQLLDASRYYIILPDAIGHGHSTRPSDSLRAKFPHYEYEDMVRAQHQLIFEKLGVNHLRLVGGTSMGCMHSWIWAETYPDAMDAVLPLACETVPIAGRNRMMRKMAMDEIRSDPEWKNGDYTEQPRGLRGALDLLLVMTSSPLQMQKNFPTRDAADQELDKWMAAHLAATDANDLLYQFDSSRNYDPSPQLDKIQAHVLWINSADDFVNPPELGIPQREIKKVKYGRFVLLPITDQTRGHGTHTLPAVWQQYLADLLKESEPNSAAK
ncbi:MAG: alpha/beta fold hydrolase [Candidatus Acidiferrales bacterium]